MSKKHFNSLAQNLRAIEPSGKEDQGPAWKVWRECCCAVAASCADANPRFDRDRFLAACGL